MQQRLLEGGDGGEIAVPEDDDAREPSDPEGAQPEAVQAAEDLGAVQEGQKVATLISLSASFEAFLLRLIGANHCIGPILVYYSR